jgi:hypothetical protein
MADRIEIAEDKPLPQQGDVKEIQNEIRKNNVLRRQQIDIFIEAWANHVNRQIHRLFIQRGLSYVPFKLSYDTSKIGGTNIKKRQLFLHVDNKFLRKFYEEKLTFVMWLSQNHYAKAHEYYKYVESTEEGKTAPSWYKEYVKKYNKEIRLWNSSKQPPRVMNKELSSNRLFLGKISETMTVDGASDGVAEKNFNGDISAEVKRFLEHEDYIFSDKIVDDVMIRSSTNSTIKYAFKNSGQAGGMRKILNEVLKEFVKEFEQFKWNEVTTKDMEKEMIRITKNAKKGNKKYDSQYDRYKTPEPFHADGSVKFPNIQRIGEWFVNKGILKSKSLNKFREMPISGKKRFLDRMIFHIANAVYAEKMGIDTKTKKYKMADDGKTKVFNPKKAFGKGIRANTMRTRSGQTPSNDAWKTQVERWAKGMNNRKLYRRGTLTQGADESDFWKPTKKANYTPKYMRKPKGAKGAKGAKKSK